MFTSSGRLYLQKNECTKSMRIHGVVKLVVAQNEWVLTHLVHDVLRLLAFGGRGCYGAFKKKRDNEHGLKHVCYYPPPAPPTLHSSR